MEKEVYYGKKIFILTLILALGISACSKEKTGDKEAKQGGESVEVQENQTERVEMSDDLYSYQICINNIVYQLPMKYEDMIAKGWVFDGDEEELIEPETYNTDSKFMLGEDNVKTIIYNPGTESGKIKYCYVTSIYTEISYISDETKVLLPKNIKLGVTLEDKARAVLGEPTKTMEVKTDSCISYNADEFNYIRLKFDSAKGGILESVEVMHFDTLLN